MGELLRAGIRRYLHSSILWICVAFSLLIGILLGLRLPEYSTFDDIYIVAEFLVFAVLISVSIGKEYSEGGFRNKVISGHTRGRIFWAEWLIATAISLLLFILCAIPVVLLNTVEYVLTSYIVKIAIGMTLVNISSVAITFFVSIIISHKVVSPVACILLVLCLTVVAGTIDSRLSLPEYEYRYSYNQATGEYDEYLAEDVNSRYVKEPFRTVLKVVLDLLPQGQMTEYSDIYYELKAYPDYDEVTGVISPAVCSAEELKTLNSHPFYSMVLITVFSVGGFVLFRRKSLR